MSILNLVAGIARTLLAAGAALVAPMRADRSAVRSESGQTSAEYALVLLGAGAVALLIVAWATQTDSVGRLLDGVFGQLLRHVQG